ncbi:MAG: PD-(D/E)XK nuclease family protein [bacterium]|nr:PD-(D/E)XK nuclease family protein [bacterium]
MPVYSHSRLSTYENCPLQYRFRYIDRIRTLEEGIEAFMGGRVHDALEKLYRELRFRVMPLEELLAFYDAAWEKKYHDAVVIVKEGRTADDYRNLGRKCIENYYRRQHPFDDGEVIGVEERVMLDLNEDGKYRIAGVIDRLSRAADDAFEIHDYKTSGSLPSQRELDEDRQLALYQIAVQRRWPAAERVRLVWHYLSFDATMRSSRRTDQLDELRRETVRLIDRIEATETFEPVESALCDWCPYRALCPLRRDLPGARELPAGRSRGDIPALLAEARSMSTCRNIRIGAVIETPDGRRILGWNGPPGRAGSHDRCRLGGPITTVNMRDCPGVHAEVRAVCRAAAGGARIKGGTIYLTEWFPCAPCAMAIIEAGLSRLLVADRFKYNKDDCYNFGLAREYLERAGIVVQERPELSPPPGT